MIEPKVLLIVAHPAIAAGIETLLKLEGQYDIRRVPSIAQAARLGEWRPDVALVDGTLLAGREFVRIGFPAIVLSGNERDGRALTLRLDDGRGWVRKDATGVELRDAVAGLLKVGSPSRLGTLGILAIVVLGLIGAAVVAYLVYLLLS